MQPGAEAPFFRPGDLILLVLVAIPVILLSNGPDGGTADSATVVAVGGEDFTVPLDGDSTLTVEGLLGTMVIETEEGRIRVVSSPCPGQHCVMRGWVSTSGDAVICVPSEVYVRVNPSGSGTGEVDAVTY